MSWMNQCKKRRELIEAVQQQQMRDERQERWERERRSRLERLARRFREQKVRDYYAWKTNRPEPAYQEEPEISTGGGYLPSGSDWHT